MVYSLLYNFLFTMNKEELYKKLYESFKKSHSDLSGSNIQNAVNIAWRKYKDECKSYKELESAVTRRINDELQAATKKKSGILSFFTKVRTLLLICINPFSLYICHTWLTLSYNVEIFVKKSHYFINYIISSINVYCRNKKVILFVKNSFKRILFSLMLTCLFTYVYRVFEHIYVECKCAM